MITDTRTLADGMFEQTRTCFVVEKRYRSRCCNHRSGLIEPREIAGGLHDRYRVTSRIDESLVWRTTRGTYGCETRQT